MAMSQPPAIRTAATALDPAEGPQDQLRDGDDQEIGAKSASRVCSDWRCRK